MFIRIWTCLKRKKCCSGVLSLENIRLWKNLILLYILTFFVIIPAICLQLHNTMFDAIFHTNQTQEKIKLFHDNSVRFNKSKSVIQKFDQRHRSGDIRLNSFITRNTRIVTEDRHNGSKVGIAITVVTVTRNKYQDEKYDPGYLTQTVAAFLEILNASVNELQMNQLGYDLHFSVCNVDAEPDKHTEVNALPDWVPVLARFKNKSQFGRQEDLPYDSLLEKEKQDYVFCMDKALSQNLSHVLVVEDDAVPREDILPVLELLALNSKHKAPHNTGIQPVTFYKLYHPERLLGYISLEIERLPELFSLGFIFSCVLTSIYSRCLIRKHCSVHILWLVFFIYSCLVILALGRSNVNEIRRVSKFLYQTTPSPSCCTPAILFTREGAAEVSDYLKTVQCKAKFGKDIAIDKLKHKKHLVTKYIQPNLFKHIGLYSSLRSGFINPFIV